MHIRRRLSFSKLLKLLRHIEADKTDLAAVMQCNHLILKEVLHAESAILRHRNQQRELTRTLKVGRGDKAAADLIRARLKRAAGYLRAQQDAVFIWKCFGDALAFLFLDRFSIKHAFFEIDDFGIKRGAGMLTGKKGLAGEIMLLQEAAERNIPAILCDITNVLRYGDVCLLGASDPTLIEVKSSFRLNQRAKRQLAKLERLHGFLETNFAEPFRGSEGPVARVALTAPPRDNIDALNACIGAAKVAGQAIARPEPGVTYAAMYGGSDYEEVFGELGSSPRIAFMLNADKNNHAWAPYTPFLLTIRDQEHLLDFIEGRLFLIVLIDPEPLCQAMADDEWMVRFRDDPDYPIQCVHRPTHTYVAMSKQFLCRAAYEFASLAWIAEAHRPSIPALEVALGNRAVAGDSSAHEAQLRAFLGEGDPWLRELGLG
jgi:hypothetical protein